MGLSRIVLTYFFVICLSIFLKEVGGQAGNAGVKVILTQRGLDYTANQAVEVLARRIPDATIENLSGRTKMWIGKVDYEIKNAKITGFTKPSANVIVNSGQGLTMSLSGAGISADGEWRYQYKKAFIRIRDHGSFTASANGVSISVSVVVDKNSNDVPTISTRGCSCSINDVYFKLRGGASWLYNIFLRFYKNKIRSCFERELCSKAQEAINNNGAHELSTLNLQASINDFLILNYRLTSAPIFGDNFMETNHVGRFLNDDVLENPPAMENSLDRMVSVSLSDVTLNSASRVLFKNNKFRCDKNVSSEQISKLHFDETNGPVHAMTVFVGATSAPVVILQQGSISVNVEVEARIDTFDASGIKNNAFVLKFSIHSRMNAAIQEDKVVGSVLDFSPTLTYCSLPNADLNEMNNFMPGLANMLVPYVNEALSKGVPLPTVAGIHFQESSLHLNDRHITVATNVVYF